MLLEHRWVPPVKWRDADTTLHAFELAVETLTYQFVSPLRLQVMQAGQSAFLGDPDPQVKNIFVSKYAAVSNVCQ